MSLEQYQPRAELALQSPQDAAIQSLAEWARAADAAHQVAELLVQTAFCPDSFQGKPGQATAAILAGMEIGLQPMASLRSFDIIQGQAAARAITLRAVVQSHGHEIELVESTGSRCRMRGRRRGSQDWQTVTWTLERARDLGLLNRPNWKSQPQTMLVARATSEICRLVASDAILGLAYSAEEVADGAVPDSPAELADQPLAPVRTMQRRPPVAPESSGADPAASPAAEPPTSGLTGGGESSAPEPDSPLLNTRSKLAKRMFALMNESGLTDRDDRLAYVASIIGHEVESSAAMTDADAVQVITALEAVVEQPFPTEEGEPS